LSIRHSVTHLLKSMISRCSSDLTRAKHVYGYEVVPEAIADAKKNAKLNGISNATFVQGDLNKINETFGKEFPKPDIIISGLSWHISVSTYFL
jgi:tRNA/tmRNA/rRNA uracil-C5-methylase (TrmA/RlmC/RlmD family)